MNEWIDFSVYAVLIIMFWWAFATWTPGYILTMVDDRNAAWLAANEERATALLRGRWLVGSPWFLGACYLWGALSLGVLLAIQLGVLPALSPAALGSPAWEVLKDTNSILLIAGLVWYLGCGTIAYRRVQSDVPLTQRRSATLAPRSLDDFVPRWVQIGTYAVVVAQLAAWIIVGVLGLSSAPGFWVRFAAPVVFTAINIVIAQVLVNFRPSNSFGPAERRTAVRIAFAAQLYAQFRFAVQLYGEVVGAAFDMDRVLHLGLVLWMVVMILVLVVSSRNRHTHESSHWAGTRPS